MTAIWKWIKASDKRNFSLGLQFSNMDFSQTKDVQLYTKESSY